MRNRFCAFVLLLTTALPLWAADSHHIELILFRQGDMQAHPVSQLAPDNWAGTHEIFGPVTSIKRVRDFEEGINIMNANPFANGSCIYTSSGHYAREFARRTHAGMVGINVGIPVPFSTFPFTGHKDSFFGDLHCHGKDAFRFYTESKCVTVRWFDEEEMKKEKVDTWDGSAL